MANRLKRQIHRLQKERDQLWQEFCCLPKRSSFSGLFLAGRLEKVQNELDELEGDEISARYYPEITIELGYN